MIAIQKDYNNNETKPNYKWDYLVFTQQWPNTECKNWKRRNTSCRLPKNRDLWTVHGIWANKFGGKWVTSCDGPEFATSKISSIRRDLSENWVNVHDPYPNEDFWSLEWDRHGTCMLDHQEFNTQIKYFEKALEWSQEYNMKDILG